MKRHIRLLKVLALSLVLSAPLLSPAQNVRKTKVINRSYTVTAEDKLQIENSFGDVTVNTWDKPQITVDIEIGARAGSDEKAQDIFDQIEVNEDKSDHVISFHTHVGDIHTHGNSRHDDGGDNRTFYIDYVVHMPAGNPLDIHNDFGRTVVPDFKGLVNLTSKYGSLTAGNLANVSNIDVEFGKATLGDITNGKIVLQYDGNTRIGTICGNVKLVSEFSNRIQLNVGDCLSELSVSESYSGIRMVVDKDLSAQITIHTNFGEFHNESEFTIKEKHEDEGEMGPKFDRDYSGTVGDGKAQIKVKSEFGSFRLSTHGDDNNGDDDNDRKNKHKDKDKDKNKDKDKDKDSDVSVS
ncbi:MAG TPA: hypothetical protein VKR41_01290 [Puia sp.]|nr:hypothetical protein [Puia sp.]